MSTSSSGYVHISRRVNVQSRGGDLVGPPEAEAAGHVSRAPLPVGRTAGPYGAAHMGHDVALAAPLAVVSVPENVDSTPLPDATARGFVIYVGLDEQAARRAGTSLTRLVQQTRAYVHQLVPAAQSHAAVALAPVDATGTDLDVVRQALGDPTVGYKGGAVSATRASSAVNGRTPHPEAVPDLKTLKRPMVTATGALVDLARREVYLDGAPLNLTYKEFELLHFLVENRHRTVRREELLETIWAQRDEVPNERTIDVHIRRLRSKLGRLAGAVRTVRGQGYRFYDHPEVLVWTAPEYSI